VGRGVLASARANVFLSLIWALDIDNLCPMTCITAVCKFIPLTTKEKRDIPFLTYHAQNCWIINSPKVCVSVKDQEKDLRAESMARQIQERIVSGGRQLMEGEILFLGTLSKLSRFLSHPFKKFVLSLIFLLR